MNEAIATVESNARVLDAGKEKNLGENASAIGLAARAVTINTDIAYAAAAELLKKVKQIQKAVKDYWEPVRKAAKASYDSILEKKKAMLDPIDDAESILKRKMSDYTMEQERIRRELEERRRMEAQAESDRKLEEAIQMEADGDAFGAEFAMAEAEVYDEFAASAVSTDVKPKANRISMQKTWRITGIDRSRVPVAVNGVEIRPVDEAAVLRLIKAAKGNISIPGVTFIEDYSVSARA